MKKYLFSQWDEEIYITDGYIIEDFPLHIHEYTELVFILKGSGTHIIEGQNIAVSKGDVFVMNENVSHGFKDTEELKLINISFINDGTLFDDEIMQTNGYKAMFNVEPLISQNSDYNFRLSIHSVEYDRIVGILYQMIEELKNKRQCYKLIVKAMLVQVIIYLSRNYDNNIAGNIETLLKLTKTVDYIDRHYLMPLNMKELANTVNFSPRHINRLFKIAYGESPMQYITGKRMEKAKDLLKTTDDTIYEISGACGYDDVGYFIRLFKNRMGITPKQYRKHIVIDV